MSKGKKEGKYKKKEKKNFTKKGGKVYNKRGDVEPEWGLGVVGTLLSIITVIPFFVYVFIYISRWACFNLHLPNAICYIIALVFTPALFPLFAVGAILRSLQE